MISAYDYAIIGFYFLFLLLLGWYYRHSSKDSDEYFRGGGRMPWWLVGSRSFMGSFSAWTFTGAAALAYDHGIVVLVLYLGNTLMFLTNWAWTAAKFRQIRVIIGMEALRLRLGTSNEQFFIWISYPVGWLVSGIQLYGLGIICGSMFNLDIRTIIILCGISMIVLSTLGGAWGVATGNFLQTLILMPITVVVAFYALRMSGGFANLVHRLPPDSLDFTASKVPGFGAWFVVAVFLDKLAGANSISNAGTYLSVRDGGEARKVALLSGGLFLVGCLIWFIPPLVARGQGFNLAAILPSLNNPSDGAYVAIALKSLPAGLIGLFATGMISATLATMDSSLSGSAGIITRSIYLPLLRPRASERELVLVGRIATVVLGIVTILIALMYTTWKEVGIFTLMQDFGALIGVPLTVPLFWCLVVRRPPDWVAWSTVVMSLVTTVAATPLLALAPARELAVRLGAGPAVQLFLSHDYVFFVLFNFAIGSAWYLGVGYLFRNRLSVARRAQVDDFFARFNRPLSPQEISAEGSDTYRSAGIGKLILCFAGFIALLLLIPNRAGDRWALAFCAGFVGLVGFVLYWLGRKAATADEVRSAVVIES